MKKPYVIGITGGSGSGKTFFLKHLQSCFSVQQLCLISQDNYYRTREEQPVDKNGIRNFDLPESIDHQLLASDLKMLIDGRAVKKQEYTFNNPAAQSGWLEFNPAPIIVVEGLFVQYFPNVKELLDLSVFIEAKDHIKLGRRIRRDQIERGYDLDDVLYRYEHHVMPVYERLIDPLKHQADLIVPNNQHVLKAAGVLAGHIRSLLS